MTNDEIDRKIDELRGILDKYQYSATTKHLYELSRYLLQEEVERVSRLDAKAGRFASFSGGILALLLPTYRRSLAQVSERSPELALVALALGCLLVGGWCAFRAIQVTQFEWISDREIVFPSALLDFPDQLTRYHILAIYRSVLSHQQVSQKKARWMIRSQQAFLAGAGFLVLSLAAILVKPLATPLLSSLYYCLTGRNH